MSEAAKGPYSYRPREFDDWGFIRGPDNRIVAIAKYDRDYTDDDLNDFRARQADPCENTGRLLAASWEMREALDEIFSVVSYVNIHGVGQQPEAVPGMPQPIKVKPDEFARLFQKIGALSSAALAKAEGRAP